MVCEDRLASPGRRIVDSGTAGWHAEGRRRIAPTAARLVAPTTSWCRFVISHNLHRRHLTKGQRALVAGRMANWPSGGAAIPPVPLGVVGVISIFIPSVHPFIISSIPHSIPDPVRPFRPGQPRAARARADAWPHQLHVAVAARRRAGQEGYDHRGDCSGCLDHRVPDRSRRGGHIAEFMASRAGNRQTWKSGRPGLAHNQRVR